MTVGEKREESERKPLLDSDISDGQSSSNHRTSTDLWPLLQVSMVLLLHSCSSAIHSSLISQYVYARVADNHDVNTTNTQHTNSACDPNATANASQAEAQVQQEATHYLMIFYVIEGSPGILINILIGAFSDKLGRRVIFLFMIMGRLGRDLLTVAVIYWDLKLEVLYAAYTSDGVCGSVSAFYMAAYAYTADISPASKARTVAIAAIDAVKALAAGVLSLINGYIISSVGFFYAGVVMAGFTLLDLVFVVCVLRETRQPRKIECGSVLAETAAGVKNVWKFYLVKDASRSRALFWLGLSIMFLLFICSTSSVSTLYEMGPPFCWNSMTIGMYGALGDAVLAVFVLVVLRLLHLCLSQEAVGLLGCLSSAGSSLLKGLATSSLMLFLAPVVGFCSGAVSPTVRSLMSSMASPDDQGAVFASMAVVEAMTYVTGHTGSSMIYQLTVTLMRGAIFLIISGIYGLVFVLIIIFVIEARRKRRSDVTKTLLIQET